jgi:hypothetical protein
MRRSMGNALALALVAGAASGASAQTLYDNGPLVTTPTGACIPAGNQASEVQVGNINAGYNASSGAGFRVADDFTVIDPPGWQVTGLRLFSYQTGSPTTASPYTAATVQIWNGVPGAGGAVIFGDTTTNVLTSSSFSHIYRYFNATCATDRAIWNLDCTLSTILPAGTYWLDWNFTGSASFSGPWAPPTTYTGFPGPQPPHAPGNALQLIGGVYSPVVDSVPQDFAFQVNGVIVGGQVGACCRTDGTCFIASPAGCTAVGGIYRGNGSVCATANCPQPPTGACCLSTGCSVLTQAQCTAQSGTYRGNGTACATANCPPPSIWNEQGDAGDTLATAQIVSVPGGQSLTQINGSVSASGDADLYQIQICNFASFHATTVGGATMDTQLFLFNSTGHGVTSDDDDPGGAGLQSTLTSQFVTSNGIYYLAISSYDNDPIGATTGQAIWNDTPFNVERAPDGPAAAEALGGFDHAASGSGTYSIFLQGTCFVPSTSGCYANCDHSTTVPFLNVNDFICFQSAFAAGASYANCDNSTTPPVLNVNDFICFQAAFAAGCTAP